MRPGNRTLRRIVSTGWGFLEATFFFIVPDVYLGYIALSDYRKALFACLYCVAGAVVGGALMYGFGWLDPIVAYRLLDGLPAISDGMIERAKEMIGQGLLPGLLEGAFTGIPYKVFAVSAGDLGVGILAFLILSAPARYLRFFIVVSATSFFSLVLFRELSLNLRRGIYAAVWGLFYGLFFAVMPG